MTLFFGFVLLALAAWAVPAFNRLVRLRNQVRAGWAEAAAVAEAAQRLPPVSPPSNPRSS